MTEALKAVEAEAAAAPEGVLVPLTTDDGTVDILVPPANMWFEGAVEALTAGRVTDWIHLAVDDPETLVEWDTLPPAKPGLPRQPRRKRYQDLNAFLEEWTRLSGENPGKSPASKPSSRSTRSR